ncbi:MAG: VOC family protein [Opitutaceae bacterium]|nr:VOC family protein [Opitutaceae bacterium]
MNPTATLGVQRIGQIAINAKSIPSTTAFYRDVLGLTFLFGVGERMAFFDCGGVRLMLSQPSSPELDHPSSILYLVVADIDAAFDHLKRSNVVCLHEPALAARMPDHELWLCPFRDPEGNILSLMCEKRPPAAG